MTKLIKSDMFTAWWPLQLSRTTWESIYCDMLIFKSYIYFSNARRNGRDTSNIFDCKLLTDQAPRAHLGSGGWRQVWLTSLTGAMEAQSDRKVNNRCMVTTFVTWWRISGLERWFSSEFLMMSRMENRKMKTSRTAIWWADILRMV